MKTAFGTCLLLIAMSMTSAHAEVSCKATIGQAVDMPLTIENHGMGDELAVRRDGVEIVVVVDSEMLGTKAQPRIDVKVHGPKVSFSTAAAPTARSFSDGKPNTFAYAFSMYIDNQEISLRCKP